MMTHENFIFLRSKGGKRIYLFYGTYEDYLNEYNEEDRADFQTEPVPFEELDADTLSELITSIMEDRNSHRYLYAIDILNAVLREDVDKETAAKIMRHYLLCLEAHWRAYND